MVCQQVAKPPLSFGRGLKGGEIFSEVLEGSVAWGEEGK